jgi:hypothetical protein
LRKQLEQEGSSLEGLNVQTFFGTAPPIWNRLFQFMARLIPQKLLQNPAAMASLAQVSLPMVRLVDSMVGSSNGIRVDARRKGDGQVISGLLTHQDLEKAVGDSIAAFVSQLDSVLPGVYFPEEAQGLSAKAVIDFVKEDAISYRVGESF